MGDGFSLRIDGINELRSALEELPEKVNKLILRQAIKPGAQIFFDEVKSRTPHATFHNSKQGAERLVDSLKISSRSRRGSVGYGISGNYYGRFVEFGHVVGKRGKGISHAKGASRKARIRLGLRHVPAYPFIRPAFESSVNRVTETIAKQLGEGINREFDKAAKRAAAAARRQSRIL